MSRVALVGENSIGYINSLIDIWNNGDCAVLLDWRIPFPAMLQMMTEADVKICYIEKSLYEKLYAPALHLLSFVPFDPINTQAAPLPDFIYDKFCENYSNDEAVVIYSSGTTGASKGIILSHFAINTNADAIIDYMKPTLKDCIYIAKTLSHSSTLTGELLVALKSSMRLIIAPTIVPPRYIFRNIEKYDVTIICLNPTLLSLFADRFVFDKYNISSLRVIYVSGSILNDKIYEKAHSAFSSIPIYNVYGLSEAGPRVTAQRVDCCKSNSVGKPINNVDIALVDESGNKVPNGTYGIIHVTSLSEFAGYIVGEKKHASLYNEWHNTGDIGYIDEYGELHIVNRLDDVIIIDSHKVYPSEVEKEIMELSDIKECAVVKLECNNNEFIGCLYVSEKEIDMDIKEKLKVKLLTYEIPRFFLRCDSLPRTQNGKVSTREVQACLRKYISQE